MDIEIDKIKEEVARIGTCLSKEGILAIGLFGSLTRGDCDKRSDIDIFVITEREFSLFEQDELYFAFSKLTSIFQRDVTVLVYDMEGLKRVPSWQTLNLIKDAMFVYDGAHVSELFKRILEEAERVGIIYDENDGIFRSKRPGRIIFSVK